MRALAFIACAACFTGGIVAEHWFWSADVSLTREADGVRCDVGLRRGWDNWSLQSMTVARAEPEPCDYEYLYRCLDQAQVDIDHVLHEAKAGGR